MKIAITGAHCVGKTTLAEKLQEHITDYELKAEPYYELAELGYSFSEIPNVYDFIEQLEYSIKQISKSGDNVIFDRCPVDFLAYIKAIDESRDIQLVFNNVERIMSKIDLLVFVPIDEPDLIICGKTHLPELRSRVNEILNDWKMDFGIETVVVNGTLLNRRDQILSKLSRESKDQNAR
jgi:deoxyadenosine/deoxycytidine kinase